MQRPEIAERRNQLDGMSRAFIAKVEHAARGSDVEELRQVPSFVAFGRQEIPVRLRG